MANENVEGIQQPSGAGGAGDTTQTQTQNPSGGGQTPRSESGAGSGGQFAYKEDRSDWVPRHRLNEVSSKAEQRVQQLEKRLQEIEAGQSSRNTEIARALGINAPTAEEKEAEELRQTLYRLVPGLQNLDRLDPDKLEAALAAAEGASETTVRHWSNHAEKLFTDLEAEVAEGFGVETLTPSQAKKLRIAYTNEAKAAFERRQIAAQRGEQPDPNDFLARHERGDKTLITEFAKEWVTDWAEPVRRSTQAQLARRNRPVPSGDRSRTLVTGKMPEIDFNDEEAFKKALVNARNGG